MGNKFNEIGFWTAIDDEESARDAIRMAGLPLFLMGLGAGFIALGILLLEPVPLFAAIVTIAIAALFILLALQLRARRVGWFPLAMLLYAAALGLNLVDSVMAWRQSDPLDDMARTLILIRWIIPILCLFLMLNGVRGWLWLRAHRVRPSA